MGLRQLWSKLWPGYFQQQAEVFNGQNIFQASSPSQVNPSSSSGGSRNESGEHLFAELPLVMTSLQ